MSNEIFDALNMEPTEITRPEKVHSMVPKDDETFIEQLTVDKKIDYVFVRDNMKNLIAEVDMVINDAVQEVRSNPTPRMYEAFCQLVQVYSNANNQLLKMHTPNEQKPNKESQPDQKVNNLVFVGTSDSLIDQIKRQM